MRFFLLERARIQILLLDIEIEHPIQSARTKREHGGKRRARKRNARCWVFLLSHVLLALQKEADFFYDDDDDDEYIVIWISSTIFVSDFRDVSSLLKQA